MSKLYKLDMNIETKDFTPTGQFLIKNGLPREADPDNPDQEFDPRGFRERTGAEIFFFMVDAAISGANPQVNYDQLKGFRKLSKELNTAVDKGQFICNKTDIDIMKNSVRGNRGWPNTAELFLCLEMIMEKLDNAKLVTENPTKDATDNPTPNDQGENPKQEKQPS